MTYCVVGTSFGWLDRRSARSATAVIVFLTETAFHNGTEIFDALAEALSAGATVVFVAETEMAHGWSTLPQNSSWSDGVDFLKGNVPAPHTICGTDA